MVQQSFGLVVNLSRDNTMNLVIGALLLNPSARLSEGAKVHGISSLASINQWGILSFIHFQST